jgi:hypothetical protein
LIAALVSHFCGDRTGGTCQRKDGTGEEVEGEEKEENNDNTVEEKGEETSGAALRYADAGRGRVTRSAYVRKMG